MKPPLPGSEVSRSRALVHGGAGSVAPELAQSRWDISQPGTRAALRERRGGARRAATRSGAPSIELPSFVALPARGTAPGHASCLVSRLLPAIAGSNRRRMASRTARKAARRSSSEPVASAGSGNETWRCSTGRGKSGQTLAGVVADGDHEVPRSPARRVDMLGHGGRRCRCRAPPSPARRAGEPPLPGTVPAERASHRSPRWWLTSPSAICERHELPVHRIRTRLRLSGVCPFSTSAGGLAPAPLTTAAEWYDISRGDEMRTVSPRPARSDPQGARTPGPAAHARRCCATASCASARSPRCSRSPPRRSRPTSPSSRAPTWSASARTGAGCTTGSPPRGRRGRARPRSGPTLVADPQIERGRRAARRAHQAVGSSCAGRASTSRGCGRRAARRRSRQGDCCHDRTSSPHDCRSSTAT